MVDPIYYKVQYPLKKAIDLMKDLDNYNLDFLGKNLSTYDKEKITIFLENWNNGDKEKLISLIQKKIKDKDLKEIILALSLNPDGENTIDYVSEQLKLTLGDKKIKITTLGRGLSTGTELEYLDDNTFQNAFKNRN
jgi:hypothetical protein